MHDSFSQGSYRAVSTSQLKRKLSLIANKFHSTKFKNCLTTRVQKDALRCHSIDTNETADGDYSSGAGVILLDAGDVRCGVAG